MFLCANENKVRRGVFSTGLVLFLLVLSLCTEVIDLPRFAVAQESLDGGANTEDHPLDFFLGKMESMTADFSQQLWNADNQLVETSIGKVMIRKPNRFLWSYSSPIEQVILSDGQSLWIYDIELEQATVTPLGDAISATPAMLLSGDSAARESFEVLDYFEVSGVSWARLGPATKDTDFSVLLIGFRDSVPEQLELTDGLSQVTQIEFSNVELNPRIANSVFEFIVPDGVDVIGGIE